MLLSQVCSIVVLLHYVQRPRVERAAAVFADYVTTLDDLLAATPPASRAALSARLDAREQLPPEATETPPHDLMRSFRTYQREVFLDSLQKHLPPTCPRAGRPRARSGCGFACMRRLTAPPTRRAHRHALLDRAADSRGRAGAAASKPRSFYRWDSRARRARRLPIQLHLNGPLHELTQAARRVSAGDMPAPLPTDGPAEIAAVGSAFNQMTHALQEAEATRALMLAGISHDIRTPLTKLRLSMAMAMPQGADEPFVIAAESYLDQIETILQQFMDYAGAASARCRSPAI